MVKQTKDYLGGVESDCDMLSYHIRRREYGTRNDQLVKGTSHRVNANVDNPH